MFTGTTPPEVKLLLQDLMTGVEQKDVYIGCSGNYTTDKVMAGMGYKVHSNDVSLYSKLISDIILGRDTTPIKVTNEELERTFATWEETPYKKLCQVMYAMRISNIVGRKNQYQIEMMETFLDQSEYYYKSTMERLKKGALDFKIEDFFYGDFVDFLKSKQGKGVGISFPPTYRGGYEKIFSFVEANFEYEHAPYNIFDPKEGGKLFGELLESDKNIIYSDKEWENLDTFLAGKIKLGPLKHPVFIYSSINPDKRYYFERRPAPKKVKSVKLLPDDYEFTEQTVITIKQVETNVVNHYKAFYMANKVNYQEGGDFSLAFIADGMVFGFATYSTAQSTLDYVFDYSDFVIPLKTGRVSKLLIMLMKSSEVRRRLCYATEQYYTSMITPVFTDKPSSMKYRGTWKLLKREKGKLIYGADFVEDKLQTIYNQWLKKNKK